jgi:cytochrome b pre-mRNA-processing protein 3
MLKTSTSRLGSSLFSTEHNLTNLLSLKFTPLHQQSFFSTQSDSKDGFYQRLCNTPPRSLAFPRLPDKIADESTWWKRAILKATGYYSKEVQLIKASQNLYSAVKEQADNPSLHIAFDLTNGTFHPRYAFLCLHVWLVLVRLRPEGKDGKKLAQEFYDNFQEDVETRVRQAGVKVRISKQLTELEKMFYGSSFAYDRAAGLVKLKEGEKKEDLMVALHRNVYNEEEGKLAAAKVLEKYVMRELACISMTESSYIMDGNIRFSVFQDR